MHFEEYQRKAITTRHQNIYHNLKYFSMGLIGEAGELVDKVKKILRDDSGNITKDRRNAIRGEIGDVLWYLANICEETEIKMDDLHLRSELKGYAHHGDRNIFDLSCYIANKVSDISISVDIIRKNPDDTIPEAFGNELAELFILLEEFCTACALDITMVSEHNIQKLFDRQERGVISGEGDNR